VGAGQVAIQHDHVVAGYGQVVQRTGAVEDDVDRHALPA
jgi:hypothetical protein